MGKGKVAWCTTLPAKDAGGFRTILQNARALERAGYISDFYFLPDETIVANQRQILGWLRDWYGYEPNRIFPAATKLTDDYDLAIATAWNTASFVADQTCNHKAYFVQDYEPWFFPMGADYIEAQASYNLGLIPITIGRWLAKTCQSYSHQPVYFTDFCADLSVYHPLELKREYAVCAIYQPDKSRRASKLLLEALEIVKEIEPGLNIYLYGSKEAAPSGTLFKNLGILPVNDCNKLYNSCQIGISMSTSNPSRIPFEMMASGLPVIDLLLPNNLFDMPEEATLLAEPNAASLATTVLELLNDSQRRKKMSASGTELMKNRDIQVEEEQFTHACENIINESSAFLLNASPLYTQDAIPVNECARKISLTRREQRRAESSRRSLPLGINISTLHVSVSGLVDEAYKIRLACWSRSLQEDITWTDLAVNKGIWECNVKLEIQPDQITLFHFHFYVQKSKDNDQQFAASFDKAIWFSANLNSSQSHDSLNHFETSLTSMGTGVTCTLEARDCSKSKSYTDTRVEDKIPIQNQSSENIANALPRNRFARLICKLTNFEKKDRH